MKEILEIRINYEYSHLLFEPGEGRNLGTSVKVVELSKDNPKYKDIPMIAHKIRHKYNKNFFFGWQFKRIYTRKELDEAKLFSLKIKSVFTPTGEECGTLYDETATCEICGANRKQVGP